MSKEFYVEDVKIEEDLSKYYVVSVWKNQWIRVSRHKYLSNAEVIHDSIVKGLSREEVKEIIKNQDSRCNTLLLKYFENWC